MSHRVQPASSDQTASNGASDGVNFTAVLAFGVGLIVVAVAVHLLVWLLFRYFDNREAVRVTPEYPLAIGAADRKPPEPRLQERPREDLRELRQREDAVLNRYEWIDRGTGVVRIPVDEAIKITARRGLPARQGK